MQDNKLKDGELPRPTDTHQLLSTGAAGLTTLF